MRKFQNLSVLAVAAMVLTACAGREPNPPGLSTAAADIDWSKAQTLTVKLDDFDFTPAHLTFQVGTPVRLVLVNTGTGDHDFYAPGFFAASRFRSGGAVPAKGGIALAKNQTVEVDLMPTAPGTFPLECTEFLHAMFGMTGNIAVTAPAS